MFCDRKRLSVGSVYYEFFLILLLGRSNLEDQWQWLDFERLEHKAEKKRASCSVGVAC